MNIAIIIPAHMASVRFPGKVLFDLKGLPMIEHVRRRAEIAVGHSNVFVATCDKQVADLVAFHGGNVITTRRDHKSGMSRICEAAKELQYEYYLLLQGDEPLVLPSTISKMVDYISEHSQSDLEVFNLVSPCSIKEYRDDSVVKAIGSGINDKILYMVRNYLPVNVEQFPAEGVKKVQGLIGVSKHVVRNYTAMTPGFGSITESIEQLQFLENGVPIRAINSHESLPTVNHPRDVGAVLQALLSNAMQAEIFEKIRNR